MSTRVPEFEILEGDTPFILRWKNPPAFTEDEFVELIELNDDVFIEQECDGSLLLDSGVMLPTNLQEMEVYFQLRSWADKDATGKALGPTGRYNLPNRARRGPDAAWVKKERITALPEIEQTRRLPHLVPDFAVEVRSISNRLRRLQAKMEEYIANGVRLAWLIDPTATTVYVYRPEREVQVIENATSIDGSPELPGFVLDLTRVWG
jgi:Uma2 family endonuclease